MIECDVAVIGSGPGGYVSAIRAAQRGAKTVVVERGELGGVCLNWGCIPTKTFIYTAELYRKLQHAGDLGLVVEGAAVDMKALVKRKDGVVRRNKAGIANLLKKNGIELVKGEARVTAPGTITTGEEDIQAKAIIVATGSSPAQLPGLEIDGEKVIGSYEALKLESIPERVLVVGAGALGAEFACIWNALGSQVCMVEMMSQVLPNEDAELGKLLEKSLKKRKMDVRTETTVKELDRSGKSIGVTFDGKKADPIEVDLVLIGIGRHYHSDLLDPSLGVDLGPRGQIRVDERMETSVPGIYAIGDVTGITMLAHGASAEGLVAAENASGGDAMMDYRVVPACTFTSPEVASVGLTEAEAKKKGFDVKVGRFSFAASGRAATMGETEGMVKIVGDSATDEVLGVHIMGPEAGELVAEAAMAMKLEATVEEIAHTIHTHPTLAETLMEAADDYFGIGIHTPPSG